MIKKNYMWICFGKQNYSIFMYILAEGPGVARGKKNFSPFGSAV